MHTLQYKHVTSEIVGNLN